MKEKIQRFFSDTRYAVACGIGTLIITFIFLIIFLAVSSFTSLGYLKNEVENKNYPNLSISVSGKGEVIAKPDIATIYFSSVEVSESVDSAQKISADKVNQVIEIIKKNGIEEKDIKTTQYNVYPKKEWQSPVCPAIYPSKSVLQCPPGREITVGFEVSQTIQIKIRDTSKVGTVLSAIGDLGITEIQGPNFEIDNIDNLKAEARDLAIKQAKEEAKKIAKNLGVKIKRVVGFYEEGDNNGDYYGSNKMGYEMMDVSSVPEIQTPSGEQKITSKISVTFEIEN